MRCNVAETALARTSRALDLVPYLLEHPGISLSDLAQAFDTTTSQLVSDLNLLFVCGLPGYSPLELIDLSFDDGFVSVIDPQVLDQPRTFTQGEVVALKLALSALAQSAGLSEDMRTHVLTLNHQLSARLPSQATSLSSHLAITPENLTSDISERIATINSTLRSGHGLSFNYLSATQERPTQRSAIPQSLTKQGEWYYLQAYLPTIGENRTFRLDRMSELQVLAQSILSPKSPSSEGSPKTTTSVTIRVGADGLSFLEENSTVISKRTEGVDGVEISMEIFDREWLIREMLGYLGSCQVLAPTDLAQEIASRASDLLAKYRDIS